MSADGAAVKRESSRDDPIGRREFSPGLADSGASANPAEVDVLRNSLSAVMVEHHEQSKKFASLAADHAGQSQDIATLTAQNIELSRDFATLAGKRDALATERDDLRTTCHELRSEYNELLGAHAFQRERAEKLEKRLFEIESSTSWLATRRVRALFARHPRLHRLAMTVRSALARP
jgi:chromosome segregation ATPase